MKIHAIIMNIVNKLFECRACDFTTDNLTEVSQHVVRNQFVVTNK